LSYSNNSNICSITFILVAEIEVVVQKTLEELEKYKLIPEYELHKKNILVVLKEAAKMEATLTTEMVHIDFIKNSFVVETYRMEVVEKSDGQLVVQVHRKGCEFHTEIMLMSINDIEIATVLQWASLVLDLFLFVLSCAGNRANPSEDAMKTLVQEVEYLVEEPAFQKALNTFLEAWKEASKRQC
jgi:hypothetical protein